MYKNLKLVFLHIYDVVMQFTMNIYSIVLNPMIFCLAILIGVTGAITRICVNYLYQYFGTTLHFIII